MSGIIRQVGTDPLSFKFDRGAAAAAARAPRSSILIKSKQHQTKRFKKSTKYNKRTTSREAIAMKSLHCFTFLLFAILTNSDAATIRGSSQQVDQAGNDVHEPGRQLTTYAAPACNGTTKRTVNSLESSCRGGGTRGDCAYYQQAKTYLEDNCSHAFKYSKQRWVSSGGSDGGGGSAWLTDWGACLETGVFDDQPDGTIDLEGSNRLNKKSNGFKNKWTSCADLGFTNQRGTVQVNGNDTPYYK